MEQGWRLDEAGRRWFDRILVLVLLVPLPLLLAVWVDWPHYVFPLLEIAPLWWRRRYPLAVFVAVAVASAVQAVVAGYPVYSQVAFPIAVYSVARWDTARRGLAALLVGWCGAGVASVRWMMGFGMASPLASPQSAAYRLAPYVITIGAIVTTAWALGAAGRNRDKFVNSLIERSERLERDAAQQAEIAASDERARIAREMHDVVAHGLSVIVVQADGARYAATDPTADPDRARHTATSTLETVSATAREALTEMRTMLGLLRESPNSLLRPQPGLADLSELVAATVKAGTPVRAELPRHWPATNDAAGLTTYRIVQEALTNVRKHAGPGARATVTVGTDRQHLSVRVTDDGRGPATPDDGRGHSLVGMRERVGAHGGTLHAGPRTGGGFEVSARIPL